MQVYKTSKIHMHFVKKKMVKCIRLQMDDRDVNLLDDPQAH